MPRSSSPHTATHLSSSPARVRTPHSLSSQLRLLLSHHPQSTAIHPSIHPPGPSLPPRYLPYRSSPFLIAKPSLTPRRPARCPSLPPRCRTPSPSPSPSRRHCANPTPSRLLATSRCAQAEPTPLKTETSLPFTPLRRQPRRSRPLPLSSTQLSNQSSPNALQYSCLALPTRLAQTYLSPRGCSHHF